MPRVRTSGLSLDVDSGIAKGYVIDMTTLADYRAVMEVNYFAMINVTKTFLRTYLGHTLERSYRRPHL